MLDHIKNIALSIGKHEMIVDILQNCHVTSTGL